MILAPLSSFQMYRLSAYSHCNIFLPKLTVKAATTGLVIRLEQADEQSERICRSLPLYLQAWQPSLTLPAGLFTVLKHPSSSKPIKYTNTLTC